MRIGTVGLWLLAGLGLLAIGTLASMFPVTADATLAEVLIGVGFVYFIIGVVLAMMHDRHMVKRWRARNQ